MLDHQEMEKQKLLEVKAAFQELKAQGEKSGRMKKSKMTKILKMLGVQKILEIAKKKESAYTMSIMDRVNLCADFWLGKIENKHPKQTQLVDIDLDNVMTGL